MTTHTYILTVFDRPDNDPEDYQRLQNSIAHELRTRFHSPALQFSLQPDTSGPSPSVTKMAVAMNAIYEIIQPWVTIDMPPAAIDDTLNAVTQALTAAHESLNALYDSMLKALDA